MAVENGARAGHAAPFRIGRWEVRPPLNRISDGETAVQIEPRLIQVLVCLVERAGEVVPRSELLEAVWPDVVVGEESLTGAVSELRRILGDDANAPRYIETIRKSGYRLVAEVDGVVDPTPETGDDDVRPRLSRLAAAGIAVTVAAAVVIGYVVSQRGRTDTETGFEAMLATGLEGRPFTSFEGNEVTPAISPDGTRMAFAWAASGGGAPDFDLYVKQENTETPLRLTESPGLDAYPAWSPDGTWISYFHQDESGSGIFVVPSIGGERRLLIPGPGLEPAHAWSPDGSSIVYAERRGLFVLDRESGTNRRLTDPPARCCGDGDPRFSPDGGTVAFVRTDGARLDDLFLVPAAGGEAKRLTQGLVKVRGFDWSADGSALVTSSIRGGRYGLWKVDPGSGEARPVPTGDRWIVSPTLAREGGLLGFQEVDLDINLWRYRPDHDPEDPWVGEPLIRSTRIDLEAAFSPGGEQIAFTSGRSGSLELWTCAADGSRPVRLTSFGGVMVTGPEWSPDGRRIAFTACPGDSCEAFVVEAEGGRPQALTDAVFHSAVSGWSADGRLIYLSSDRSGQWELYAVGAEGSTELRQITDGGGISGREDAEGRFLYFSRPERSGLWRIDLAAGASGEPEEILSDLPRAASPGQWGLCRDGVVTVGSGDGGAVIAMLVFDSGEILDLARIPEPSSIAIGVAPDCGAVLLGSTERGSSDLMVANL